MKSRSHNRPDAVRLPVALSWLVLLVCLCGVLPRPLGFIGCAEAADNKKADNKKNDAEERRLRNEIKERDEHIRKLKKELDEKEAHIKKLQQEATALHKRPMVPTDNIALAPYDTHQLFAKDQPAGTGPVVFQFKKGATLLLVWKHSDGKSDGGKSAKWEYATVRLTAESNTHELRVNLHKGAWSVYRSSPKVGYVHIGDVRVSDQSTAVPVPDAD